MTAPDPRSRQDDLELAIALADRAAGVILPHYRRCSIEWKPDGSEVTAADRAAEELIRDHLARERPEDGILGEEFGERSARPGNNRRWLVDPIDGTASFVLGLPSFGTLVALLEGENPVVGVIHLPATGETTFAATGLGCWWRPEPGEKPSRVQVAEPVPMSEALASTTGPHSSDLHTVGDQIPYRLGRLIRACRKFFFIGDCIQHAMVCRGRLHVAIDTLMSPWDIAALVPCVEEAGGIVSGLDGTRDRILEAGSLLSTCDPALHREAVRLLSPSEGD